MPDLIPVEGNPFNVNLVPVDYDPWAGALQGDVGAAMQQQNAIEAQRRATAGGLLQHFMTPGQVSQGVQPETPGVMTEADAYRLNQLEDQARNWAPQQAMNMIGTGVPMAQAGALGAAGGRGIVPSVAQDLPDVLYHGTRDAEKIRASGGIAPSKSGEFGPGVYLGPDPGTADFFATSVARGEEGPSIIPVNHTLKNPFYTTKQDWLEMLGANRTPRQVQEQLKKQGYDSIVAKGLGGGGVQVVAFDRKSVKPSLVNLMPVEHDPFVSK